MAKNTEGVTIILYILKRQELVKTVNIHFAKTNLSKLIEDVLTNERVIICRNHQPIVELKRIKLTDLRKPGLWRGRVRYFNKNEGV